MAQLDWTPPTITEYAEYSWNTDYAAEVHELQGDNWTDKGLAGSNLPEYMINEYQKFQDLNKAFSSTVDYLGARFQENVPVKTGELKASYQVEYKPL